MTIKQLEYLASSSVLTLAEQPKTPRPRSLNVIFLNKNTSIDNEVGEWFGPRKK